MSERQINKNKRLKVLKRDNYACMKCKMKFKEGYGLEIHHKKSFSDKGSDNINNLVCLCKMCHVLCPINPEEFEKWLVSKKVDIDDDENSIKNDIFIKHRDSYYLMVGNLKY